MRSRRPGDCYFRDMAGLAGLSFGRVALVAALSALTAPVSAGHAAIVSRAEAQALEALVAGSRTVRIYCLPCGDTAWKAVRVTEAQARPARPFADEWALYLNGTPIDAAYLYLWRNNRWENSAWAAGLRFPDIPPTLGSGVGTPEERPSDTAFGFFAWAGTYRLVDSLRSAESRHPASVEHLLHIFDFGDSLTAKLEVNGVGIAKRMGLAIRGREDTLAFVLHRYLKQNFGKPYPPGTRLFSLVRLPGGVMSTRWHAMRPKARSAETSGFRRLDEDPHRLEE